MPKKTPESGSPPPGAAAEGADAGGAAAEQSKDLKMEAEFKREELRPLIDTIVATGVSPAAGLNVVETFNPGAIDDKLKEELGMIAEDYGLSLDDMRPDQQAKFAALWLGAKEGRSQESKKATAEALEAQIAERLTEIASDRIERLAQDVRGAKDLVDLEARLGGTMEAMRLLAKNLTMDDDHEDVWKKLASDFRGLVDQKRGAKGVVREAFEKAFAENAEFIEDELVAAELQRSRGDVESITREFYGRSKEEQETLKAKNRAEVAAEIARLNDVAELDPSVLEKLHQINNKNIVPKDFSKIRTGDKHGMAPTFFERIGLLSDDLKPELEDLMKEANGLRAKEIGDGDGQISKEGYAMRAAQLHNDLLDMHPFSDRNGSTALLFLETLMTKAGYEPPAAREKDYYKNLGNILGNNETAMALVVEEQRRMKNEPGYFIGDSNKSPEQRKKYDQILNLFRSIAGKPRIKVTGETDGE